MNYSESGCFNPFFSHIYVERALIGGIEEAGSSGQSRFQEQVSHILSHFPKARVVVIEHYKDMFNRSRQNSFLQKQSPALILAQKSQNLIYPGAPVCQDFGNRHFYYTSCMMNCIFDCEYCYLQGMYPSANIVVFLNLQEVFDQVDSLLIEHPSVYLCVSFDTDLMAMEQILGFCRSWCLFAASRPGLTIEIRTKSAAFHTLSGLEPSDRVILAWTLSPQEIVSRYEHHTASLAARLASAREAIDKGWQVRLCFDPLLMEPDWKVQYRELAKATFDAIPADSVLDASLGSFRVSCDYLKRMRRQRPDSIVLNYPFEADHGVYHYGAASEQITDYMADLLKNYLPEEKLFIWKGSD